MEDAIFRRLCPHKEEPPKWMARILPIPSCLFAHLRSLRCTWKVVPKMLRLSPNPPTRRIFVMLMAITKRVFRSAKDYSYAMKLHEWEVFKYVRRWFFRWATIKITGCWRAFPDALFSRLPNKNGKIQSGGWTTVLHEYPLVFFRFPMMIPQTSSFVFSQANFGILRQARPRRQQQPPMPFQSCFQRLLTSQSDIDGLLKEGGSYSKCIIKVIILCEGNIDVFLVCIIPDLWWILQAVNRRENLLSCVKQFQVLSHSAIDIHIMYNH